MFPTKLNFFQLPKSDKSEVRQESNGTQKLELRNIDPKDAGLYTCKAKTKAGDIHRTDAKLVVKGQSFGHFITSTMYFNQKALKTVFQIFENG